MVFTSGAEAPAVLCQCSLHVCILWTLPLQRLEQYVMQFFCCFLYLCKQQLWENSTNRIYIKPCPHCHVSIKTYLVATSAQKKNKTVFALWDFWNMFWTWSVNSCNHEVTCLRRSEPSSVAFSWRAECAQSGCKVCRLFPVLISNPRRPLRAFAHHRCLDWSRSRDPRYAPVIFCC